MTKRPAFLQADGKTMTPEWIAAYKFEVKAPGGKVIHYYVPTPKQLDFHESIILNVIMEGSRGTGKSLCIRNDAHMRALSRPGYTYLIIRRTMPELKKSHLRYINREMRAFGGSFHKGDYIATYPNGSQGFFSHCETEDDMLKLLSSEYDAIYFDEITTFTWVMVTKISSCIRVGEGSGLLGIVRGGTNPIGPGAAEVRRYFITKDVPPEEDADYQPNDYLAIHTTLEDNPFIDRVQYIKQLSKLPEHIKRAWLHGEWIIEGAYFHDYKPMIGGVPWHVALEYPRISNKAREVQRLDDPFSWIRWYRAIDWGFSPDPAVCLWIASLPNSRAFVYKERHWKSTPARQVAKDIVADSYGMRIVESYCDPNMFFGSEATEQTSIGDIFESNGVPLTKSKNDRAAAGFAIHEYLNTVLDDKLPKIQIYEFGCPQLCRTLPEMRVHKTDPRKIADGNDHWVIALAYFCLGVIGPSVEERLDVKPKWMRPNPNARGQGRRLGHESVRRSRSR